ncbi:MAG: bifunctional demethylmenaquinone methyltransferase/2-methoxy-6-polyprenyl-1,4-benzoquinol methylase UbiE, partial [Planctomycetota bacterium]|nr:bifunctional demethylmenaquinone methyltransferase/2-methoxy-6-polyprenyl-1,4-benzoquinol methylase UbiE [Planctomycetota bacterium]
AQPAWTSEELATNPHANSEKANKVKTMFAAIARSYELNNTLHSFGRDRAWRRAAVRAATPQPTDHVLDVACGTGDLARAFARAGVAAVTGLDFTPQMLDVARQHEREKPSPLPITYVEGDAMALPFESESFDILSIAFGIRNVAEPARAIAEFFRVLRPGGRLVILEFDRPAFPPIAWANDLYCNHIMPFTATLISRDRSGAYHYLPRSVRTFLGRERMASLITEAGFSDLKQRPLTFGVCVCHAARKPA